MSPIARFLQIQFELGKLALEQLRSLVGVKITEAEYRLIVDGGDIDAGGR